jgi:ribosome-binding factor A
MQPSRRPQRLALQIQQEISLLISRNMKDRRIGFVTITGVRLTPDLQHAKVFISMMGPEDEKKASLDALNHANGWVRHELGQRIRTRFIPELVFYIDTSQEYGEHIDHLIDQIHEHEGE